MENVADRTRLSAACCARTGRTRSSATCRARTGRECGLVSRQDARNDDTRNCAERRTMSSGHQVRAKFYAKVLKIMVAFISNSIKRYATLNSPPAIAIGPIGPTFLLSHLLWGLVWRPQYFNPYNFGPNWDRDFTRPSN